MFAEGINSAAYVLYGIFRTSRSIGTMFRTAPDWNGARDFSFPSARTGGYRAWSDPYAANRYYRSVIGNLNLTASTIRSS